MTEVKLNLSQVLEIYPKLEELSKIKIRGKTAYRVAKWKRKVESEVKQWNETKMELLKRLGYEEEKPELDSDGEPKLDDNGDQLTRKTGNWLIKPGDENWEEFEKEINDIVNDEVEFSGVAKLSLKALDEYELEADLLEPLLDLIDEEENEDS
jgi:hypothetical protein